MRLWESLRRAIRFVRGTIGTPPSLATRTTSPEQIEEPSGDETSYSADQPIKSQSEDRFNRWSFAERVADTLARRPSSAGLVVAICGIWGDGKTSTLNLLAQALKKYQDVVIVRFNPWLFESQAKLLEGFFATLADALGRALSTKVQEVGRILNRYGAILSVASVGLGTAARELGKSLSVTELEELKKRLEGFLREENKRVVVLIDDIDRLDRQEIQAMFKLVKLSAGFEYTSYVLAFDDDVVAAALGEQYAEGGKEAGRNFLEKIVQVPLHLPPVDQLILRKFAFEGAEAALTLAGIQLSEEQGEAFGRHFVDGLELRLTTPRQAKRYANALSFALPILKGEVHPVDQMLIEGIRVYFPALYVAIRENPDVFLCEDRDVARNEGFREHAAEIIDKALKDLSQSDRERIRRRLLEVLFPRLKSVFGNVSYGSDAEDGWDREQRICSRNYYDRYFQYGVPPGDVPDLVVERLLRVAATDDIGAKKIFGDILERGGMRRLIEKLRRVEEKVERLVAERIAVLVALNAAFVPRENAMLVSDWSFRQAAILLEKLVRRVPGGTEREELARRLTREAEPLTFAAECLRWFRWNEKDKETERLLPAEVEEDIRRTVAERVQASAAQEPLYRRFINDAPYLLWIWATSGMKGEVREYLRHRFDSDPAEIDEFLAAYVGMAWGMESGLPHKSDFQRDAYDSISKLIEPEFLFEKLRTQYGAELDSPDYYQHRGGALGRRIACQFAFIHLSVKKEMEQKAKEEGGTESN